MRSTAHQRSCLLRISRLFLPTATFAVGLAVGTLYTIVDPFVRSGSGDYLNLPAAQANFASITSSTAYFPGELFISREPGDAIRLHSEAGSGRFDLSCNSKTHKISGSLSLSWLNDINAHQFEARSNDQPVRPLRNTFRERGSLKFDDTDARALVSPLISASFPGGVEIYYTSTDGEALPLFTIKTFGVQNVRAWEQLLRPVGSGWRREIIQPPAEPFSSFLRLCDRQSASS